MTAICLTSTTLKRVIWGVQTVLVAAFTRSKQFLQFQRDISLIQFIKQYINVEYLNMSIKFENKLVGICQS